MSEVRTAQADESQTKRDDHSRLLKVAERRAEDVREACRRVGLEPGARAIDVGCGPLGALGVLAEIVGPDGVVVGIDANPNALAQAERTLQAQGVSNVSLVCGNVNVSGPEIVCPPGPFDLAYCRLFLMLQADPAATLRKVAGYLKPGGFIVAHELLDDPHFPTFDPPVPAVERIQVLMFELIRRRGASPDAGRRLAELCRGAGLELVRLGGFLPTVDPLATLEHERELLAERHQAIVEHGLATQQEVADLFAAVEQAKAVEYRGSFYALTVELIARVA